MTDIAHTEPNTGGISTRITLGGDEIKIECLSDGLVVITSVFDGDTLFFKKRTMRISSDKTDELTCEPPKDGIVRFALNGRENFMPSAEFISDRVGKDVAALNDLLGAVESKAPERVAKLKTQLIAMKKTMMAPVTADYRENPLHQPRDENGKAFPGGPWIKYSEGKASCGKKFDRRNGVLAISVPNLTDSSDIYLTFDTKLNRDILASKAYEQATDRDKNFSGFPPIGDAGFLKKFAADHKEDGARFKEDFDTLKHQNNALAMALASETLMNVTGVHCSQPGKPGETMRLNPVSRGKLLGTYTVSPDQTMVAAADYEGTIYIGRKDAAVREKSGNKPIITWLEDNGFTRHDDLAVPFSHGEKPVMHDAEGKELTPHAKAGRINALLSSPARQAAGR